MGIDEVPLFDNDFLLHTRDPYDNPRWSETVATLSGYIDSDPPAMLSFALRLSLLRGIFSRLAV